jgi:hypothetical protein
LVAVVVVVIVVVVLVVAEARLLVPFILDSPYTFFSDIIR